ncbi:hypothetical protein [Caballeronia sp. AZ1_KS37]|uniref:hypothetical protein n=1 Tax=Caballeronia sp. AZ1_KS37 TaxID=2921756 RepID=UPI002028A571|nr:hypothetical protein [Caballeronia sp. AZ1_KS37]
MYSMSGFFVEIIPEHVPDDGWTAIAQFSRQRDYRKHDEVPKATFPTNLAYGTRSAAERAATQWAREFVTSSSEVLESSLRLEEAARKAH